MQHLEEERLSYWAHMRRALGFSFICFRASVKACIHGFLPWFFQDSSSQVGEWFD